MNPILKHLDRMRDRDLRRLNNAVYAEMQRRIEAARMTALAEGMEDYDVNLMLASENTVDDETVSVLYTRLSQLKLRCEPRRAA